MAWTERSALTDGWTAYGALVDGWTAGGALTDNWGEYIPPEIGIVGDDLEQLIGDDGEILIED